VSAPTFAAVVRPGAASLACAKAACSARRLDEEGGGRLQLGAAVCRDGDRDGGLLDLGNRHRPRSQEAKYNADSAWDAAIAVLPTSDAPRAEAEQLGDAVLCDTDRAEHLAELARSCGAQVLPPARWAGRLFRWLDHVNGHRPPVAADGIRHQEERRARSA
jgi:hypothetical protein